MPLEALCLIAAASTGAARAVPIDCTSHWKKILSRRRRLLLLPRRLSLACSQTVIGSILGCCMPDDEPRRRRRRLHPNSQTRLPNRATRQRSVAGGRRLRQQRDRMDEQQWAQTGEPRPRNDGSHNGPVWQAARVRGALWNARGCCCFRPGVVLVVFRWPRPEAAALGQLAAPKRAARGSAGCVCRHGCTAPRGASAPLG